MDLIHIAHLPLGLGVGATVESLKEDEKIVGRYIVFVKEYGVLTSVSI